MMILPSINTINLFHSNKVEVAPSAQETSQVPFLGKPEKTTVHLGLQRHPFSSNPGESVPIILSPTGSPYLHAKSNGGNDTVVFQNAYSGEAAATIERTGSTFQIYSSNDTTSPVARVTQDDKVIKVVFQDDSEPTFTIHKIVQPPSRQTQTKYIIKKNGKQVASSRYWQRGDSFMLTVHPGADPLLMTCLAAIANEIYSS